MGDNSCGGVCRQVGGRWVCSSNGQNASGTGSCGTSGNCGTGGSCFASTGTCSLNGTCSDTTNLSKTASNVTQSGTAEAQNGATQKAETTSNPFANQSSLKVGQEFDWHQSDCSGDSCKPQKAQVAKGDGVSDDNIKTDGKCITGLTFAKDGKNGDILKVGDKYYKAPKQEDVDKLKPGDKGIVWEEISKEEAEGSKPPRETAESGEKPPVAQAGTTPPAVAGEGTEPPVATGGEQGGSKPPVVSGPGAAPDELSGTATSSASASSSATATSSTQDTTSDEIADEANPDVENEEVNTEAKVAAQKAAFKAKVEELKNGNETLDEAGNLALLSWAMEQGIDDTQIVDWLME